MRVTPETMKAEVTWLNSVTMTLGGSFSTRFFLSQTGQIEQRDDPGAQVEGAQHRRVGDLGHLRDLGHADDLEHLGHVHTVETLAARFLSLIEGLVFLVGFGFVGRLGFLLEIELDDFQFVGARFKQDVGGLGGHADTGFLVKGME